MDFDRQNRNGKGVRAFPFNKNGSNGTALAACCRLSINPAQQLIVYQAQSPATLLTSAEIALQNKQGKGSPYVLALMDDVVTKLLPLEEG